MQEDYILYHFITEVNLQISKLKKLKNAAIYIVQVYIWMVRECIVSDTRQKVRDKMAKHENIERYMGNTIYIATKSFQRRKHHKKRINKKWLKIYGTCEINMMPHNQVVMMDDGVIWMTKRTWEQLKEGL